MTGFSRPIRGIVGGMLLLALLCAGGAVSERFHGPEGGAFSSPQAHARSDKDKSYNLSSIVVLTRVIAYLKNYYYDTGRIDSARMFKSALEEVARSIPSVMVRFDEDAKNVTVHVDTREQRFPYGDIDSVWMIQYRISDVFRFIQPNLEKSVDPKDVEYAAINGMLDTLDPHSIHMTPKNCKEMELSTAGKFGGLGITIGIRDGNLTIIAPIQGTPAWKAGLKAKDHISRINDQSTVNMSLDEAVGMMRGDKGTSCKLTVLRKGYNDPLTFNIVRDIIKVNSVDGTLLTGRIGYIKIRTFHGKTVQDLKSELKELSRQGALKGLILDLRGNPGGLLEAAVQVADQFLDSGTVVTTVGARNQPLEINEAGFMGTEPKYPIVVLVGSSSASASEIVAGALKNNNRAVLVGDRTFGKGSVQVINRMDDGSCLKLTVAQYLTPGNVSIQSVGIVPDIRILPVYIEDDMVDFYSSDKLRREKDLDQHLEHKATIEDHPFDTLRYLYDEKRDEIDLDAPPEAINTKDFHSQFALKLLRNVGNISRREIILQRSVGLLKSIRKEEEDKIVKRFRKRKVDWKSYPVAEAAGQAEISLTTDPKGSLPAGTEATLTLTVKNTGNVPMSRLRAITDSDNPFFDGVEFFLGRVEPGKSQSWDTKVKIPKDVLNRTDDVLFRFHEEHDHGPDPLTERLEIKGLPRPSFAFTYQVDDSAGNGDGLLQKGESVALILDIVNDGRGAVVEGLATLRNADSLKDIDLSMGRVKFDPIVPGKSARVRFLFDIKDSLEGSEFPMDLAIMDVEMREYQTMSLVFHVEPPLALTAFSGKQVTLPAGTKVYASPGTEWPVVAEPAVATRLDATVSAGKWVRVALSDQRWGWVSMEAAGVPEEKTKAADALPVGIAFKLPQISIDESSVSLYTEDTTARIAGTAKDDNRLLDIYMLCNGKKVFYARNESGGLEMAFSTAFELEEGSNHITVVARESEDLFQTTRLVIFRKKAPKKGEQLSEKGHDK